MKTFTKVLVIDVGPALRALAKSYFEGHGSEQFLEAANGFEALDIMHDQDSTIDFI